jgi:hypothetical protein
MSHLCQGCERSLAKSRYDKEWVENLRRSVLYDAVLSHFLLRFAITVQRISHQLDSYKLLFLYKFDVADRFLKQP